MPCVRADIATARASRYLAQLCRHAAALGARDQPLRDHDGATAPHHVGLRAEWTDTTGVISFGVGGRASLAADATTLTVLLDAPDDATLRVMQDALTRDLIRIATGDGRPPSWQPERGT